MIAGFGRTLDELAKSEDRLQGELRETNAQAQRQNSIFGELGGSTRRWLGVLAGAASVGVAAKQVFDYNQELEGTQIAIAGLLFANNTYTDSLGRVVDASTAFQAANAESDAILLELQQASLQTAATVPQIADAFAIVYGALQQAGVQIENSAIVQLTARLTQTASAMKVPMEQIRQEINSLLTGQVTQDSTIAKRLGLDNASIKQMQANGTLVAEIMRRTEGYAKAAEAQANTFRGKLVNTIEMVTATFSRALDPAIDKSKGALDSIFKFFEQHGDEIVTFFQRVTTGIQLVVEKVVGWIKDNDTLILSVLALATAFTAVHKGIGFVQTAIRLATAPATKFVLALVAIVLVWEGFRKLAPIEIGGKTVAGYFSAFATALGGLVFTTAQGIISALEIVWGAIKSLIGGAVQGIGSTIELFGDFFDSDELRQKGKGLSAEWEDWAGALPKAYEKALEDSNAAAEAMIEGTKLAFEAKELPSIAEMAGNSMHGLLDSLLPKAEELGKRLKGALGLTGTPNTPTAPEDPAAALKAARAAEKLQEEKERYLALVSEYRLQARDAGDPLGEALAKIELDRGEALRKLEAQQEKLKGIFSESVFEADRGTLNAAFDQRAIEASRKSLAALNNDTIATLRLRHELTVNTQRETEDRRIALIKNAAERELAERLAANRRWFEDQSEKVNASIANEYERAKQLTLLEDERKRRDKRDREDADRQMRESTFGYAEYWTKLAETIRGQWRSIGQVISETILQSRVLLAETVNGFLDDLTSGQANLLKSISGLAQGLVSLWTKALTDILMSGKNVAKQLQDLFKSIHVKNEDGTTDYLGTALQGAGFGGMVGGVFQTASNYAGLGGAIGGALGAVLGALFGGGNAGIGAMIGTAIGTAIGSLIQKGQDWIRVAIVNGVVTVTEKGISGDARNEVQTQIQRKVREEMKSWQSLLDLFPQSVKEHLQKLYASGQLAKPTLNLNGGVESADLTDEGALNALADFLGNDLPKATFAAYSGAIRVALGQLGVGKARIEQLFTHWGTLQGKELHDAVERYVRVVLETSDIQAKLDAPFEEKLQAAATLGQTKPLERLDAISAAIDEAVARMEGLTDIDDIVAAQEEVNRLSKQYYEQQLQHLARIIAIQKSLNASINAQREQIELAGKDDQGKVDFFFQRMLQLRGQLEATTDEEEINRLTQQIQQYVSQAFGIASDNPELRNKLLAILGDIEGIANGQLEKAKKEVEEHEAKPAAALERAAELLMQAAEDLSGTTGREKGKPPIAGKPPQVDLPRREYRASANSEMTEQQPVMVQFASKLGELMASRELSDAPQHRKRTAEDYVAAIREAQQQDRQPAIRPEDFATAMSDALRGMEFTAVDEIVIDNGDLTDAVVTRAERRVIARLKDDPYAILPRAA